MYKYLSKYIVNILYDILNYLNYNKTNVEQKNINIFLIKCEKNNIKKNILNQNLLYNIQNDFKYIDIYIDNNL